MIRRNTIYENSESKHSPFEVHLESIWSPFGLQIRKRSPNGLQIRIWSPNGLQIRKRSPNGVQMDSKWTSLVFQFDFNLTMLALASLNYLIATCFKVYGFDNTFLSDTSRFETQNITHVGLGTCKHMITCTRDSACGPFPLI